MLLLLVVLLVSPVFAFEKGAKSVGGFFSLSRTDVAIAPVSYNLTLWPDLSYFIVDNFALDVSPGFSFSWNADGDTTTTFALGIGARYFYKKFYGGFSYNLDSYRSSNGRFRSSSDSFQLRLGRLFGIAKNIYLNTELNYNLSSNLQFRAGISIFFK
jgi:hypothetical protein